MILVYPGISVLQTNKKNTEKIPVLSSKFTEFNAIDISIDTGTNKSNVPYNTRKTPKMNTKIYFIKYY